MGKSKYCNSTSIEEKMALCFNADLENNEILSLSEKKIIAEMLYAYKASSKSSNGRLIISNETLRKNAGIGKANMQGMLVRLGELYGMFERLPGERRREGEKRKATEYILHFDKIFNPPTEPVKFDFSKEIEAEKKERKPSETLISPPPAPTPTPAPALNPTPALTPSPSPKPSPNPKPSPGPSILIDTVDNGLASIWDSMSEKLYLKMEKDKEEIEKSIKGSSIGKGIG